MAAFICYSLKNAGLLLYLIAAVISEFLSLGEEGKNYQKYRAADFLFSKAENSAP